MQYSDVFIPTDTDVISGHNHVSAQKKQALLFCNTGSCCSPHSKRNGQKKKSVICDKDVNCELYYTNIVLIVMGYFRYKNRLY